MHSTAPLSGKTLLVPTDNSPSLSTRHGLLRDILVSFVGEGGAPKPKLRAKPLGGRPRPEPEAPGRRIGSAREVGVIIFLELRFRGNMYRFIILDFSKKKSQNHSEHSTFLGIPNPAISFWFQMGPVGAIP